MRARVIDTIAQNYPENPGVGTTLLFFDIIVVPTLAFVLYCYSNIVLSTNTGSRDHLYF
ncbi:MAG: hypothetical protein JSV09_13590 [Thermoplasmata archaeon]|nr:MAG: hypothetical protein JSV09_13590 [Thermoplasmata archaeon]